MCVVFYILMTWTVHCLMKSIETHHTGINSSLICDYTWKGF